MGVLVAVLAVGCGGDEEEAPGPSLKASSDSGGVLHVRGSGWSECRRVVVKLPDPWAGSDTLVQKDGNFSFI